MVAKKKKCQVQPGKSGVVSSSENKEEGDACPLYKKSLGSKHGKLAIISSSEDEQVDELVPVELVESDVSGDGKRRVITCTPQLGYRMEI